MKMGKNTGGNDRIAKFDTTASGFRFRGVFLVITILRAALHPKSVQQQFVALPFFGSESE